jgi:cation transport ATPase
MTEESNNQDKMAEIKKTNTKIQKMMDRTRLYFYIEVVVVAIIVITIIYLIVAP